MQPEISDTIEQMYRWGRILKESHDGNELKEAKLGLAREWNNNASSFVRYYAAKALGIRATGYHPIYFLRRYIVRLRNN